MLLGALLAATKSTSGSSWVLLVALLVIYFLVYYFFLRPRWARNRQNRTRGVPVEVGEKVQTIGGLIATIVSLDDRTVTLRTDSGVELDFLRAAIGGKYQPPTAVEESEADGEPVDGDAH